MNTFKKTQPWYATEVILRRYLEIAIPYMKGSLLDAGCGMQRYKDIFKFETYTGIEINPRFNPDVVGDLRAMPFCDSKFDSILNNQVLEHVDDIDKVFSEFYRVLKPGGFLCVTIPFIARLHEEPRDYWRISEYGLRYLMNKHNFREISIINMGGFLTTQAYLWQFRIWECLNNSKYKKINPLLMYLSNNIFLTLHKFDKDRSTPFNYLGIAQKI